MTGFVSFCAEDVPRDSFGYDLPVDRSTLAVAAGPVSAPPQHAGRLPGPAEANLAPRHEFE